MTIRHIIHAVLFTLTGAALAEPVSSAFTYQGRLNHNGSPANGAYDLRFELYSAATGGSLIGTPVVLPSQIITGGLFSADLNFGGPAVFDGTAYWLAVSAKPAGTASYVPVPGRAAVRPTPYAIHSLSAAAVKDGAITSGSLANGAVTGAKLASSAVGLTQLNATGTPGSGQVLAYNGTGLSWITPPGGGGISGPWLLNGVNTYYNNGNVGIGTTSPASRMTVQTSGSSYGVEHTNGTVRMSTYVGGTSPPGGWLGTISAHPLSFFVADGSSSMTIATNGNVGIGTTSPTSKLDLRGALTIDTGADAAIFTGTGTADLKRYVTLINAAGAPNASGLKAGGVLVSDSYSYGNPRKTDLVVKGKIGVGLGDPEVRPSSVQINNQDALLMNGYQPFLTFTDANAGWAPCYIQSLNGLLAFHVTDWSRPPSNARSVVTMEPSGNMKVEGDVTANRLVLRANPAVTSEAAIHCTDPGISMFMPFNLATGRPLSITARTLTISGGADLAEPFPMSHGGLEPGTVVVIDEKHPGKLCRSTKAYDKKVAGIVSGANGIQPGISMIQEDKLEAGENVSLSGRVYVRAETGAGPIEPGDLLTTSDEPGLAMKAAHHDQAQGAILGKAMTGLSSGEGMILVLVTLQ